MFSDCETKLGLVIAHGRTYHRRIREGPRTPGKSRQEVVWDFRLSVPLYPLAGKDRQTSLERQGSLVLENADGL